MNEEVTADLSKKSIIYPLKNFDLCNDKFAKPHHST